MVMVRYTMVETTVLFFTNALVNHHPFSEVGCDLMINEQAPH
jgi:hypothetical protein